MSKSNRGKAILYVSMILGIFIIISLGKFFFYDSIGSIIENLINAIF